MYGFSKWMAGQELQVCQISNVLEIYANSRSNHQAQRTDGTHHFVLDDDHTRVGRYLRGLIPKPPSAVKLISFRGAGSPVEHPAVGSVILEEGFHHPLKGSTESEKS